MTGDHPRGGEGRTLSRSQFSYSTTQRRRNGRKKGEVGNGSGGPKKFGKAAGEKCGDGRGFALPRDASIQSPSYLGDFSRGEQGEKAEK